MIDSRLTQSLTEFCKLQKRISPTKNFFATCKTRAVIEYPPDGISVYSYIYCGVTTALLKVTYEVVI